MMKNKLALWEEKAKEAASSHPLKTLSSLPLMPGMTKETARFLPLKALKYLIGHDPNKIFPRYFFKRPFSYAYHYLRSLCKSSSYTREGDLFLYGLKSLEALKEQLLQDKRVFVIGFSYCHKPFECPSGRFSSECKNDTSNPVCQQCFIGKAMHALPPFCTHVYPLFIPTIHYIGEKMFELKERFPDHKLLFLITACEMTLEMFGHWGNMIQAKGIGVRLDGRICNTMRAFVLSEEGIKPGLTVVLPQAKEQILSIIESLWEPSNSRDDCDETV